MYAASLPGRPTTRTRMNGLKRYIRLGLVLSVVGHLAALTTGLFFVGASALHTPPPEAMVVEVVTSDEMPRFEGMQSNLHSSGSETPSPAERQRPGHAGATAATAPTAGATIATESDPAAGGQGGPSAASAGTGSDPGRTGSRREDRARKAGPTVRAGTCCISTGRTETRTDQNSR